MSSAVVETFSIRHAIIRGWTVFKQHWVFLVLLQIGTFIAISIVQSIIDSTTGFSGFVAWILGFALQLIIGMGTLSIVLHLEDGVEQSWESLFDPIDKFWVYAGAVIFTTIGTIVGLFLLIIPGVIFAVGVCFAQYLILEQAVTPQQALRLSWERTRGHKQTLALFLLALLGINMLGVIALGAGVLVTIPVTALAYAHAYRVFFPKDHAAHDTEAYE